MTKREGREGRGKGREGGQTTNFTYLDTFREVSPVVRARKVCHFPLSPFSSLSMPFPSIFPSTLPLSLFPVRWVRGSLPPSLRRPQPIGIRWFVRVRFTLPFEKGAIASHSTHLVPRIPPSSLLIETEKEVLNPARPLPFFPSLRLLCMKMSSVAREEKEGRQGEKKRRYKRRFPAYYVYLFLPRLPRIHQNGCAIHAPPIGRKLYILHIQAVFLRAPAHCSVGANDTYDTW